MMMKTKAAAGSGTRDRGGSPQASRAVGRDLMLKMDLNVELEPLAVRVALRPGERLGNDRVLEFAPLSRGNNGVLGVEDDDLRVI